MEADSETEPLKGDHSHLLQTLQFIQTQSVKFAAAAGQLKEIQTFSCLQTVSKALRLKAFAAAATGSPNRS